MAFCANCGHQISDQAQTCPSCGHPRVAAPTPAAPTAAMPIPAVVQAWPGQALGLPQDGVNSLASPGQRLVARILDGLIVGAGGLVLFFVVAIGASGVEQTSEEAGAAVGVLGFFILIAAAVVYEVGLTATRGQTVGKMAMGIKVVDAATGRSPGWGPSFVRWVIPLLMGFVPFLSIVDALWLLWDANRQCLHDKPAKTLVIRIR